jgi:MFS family permease
MGALLARGRAALHEYPTQFWLLFWGMLVSTVGVSMIWPFLLIYASQRLHQPLAVTAALLTVHSVMAFIFSFLGGPVTDRLGRKWVMAISLIMNGMAFLLLSQAETLLEFALAMAMSGAFNPLYRIGADAMMADLIPPQQRLNGYSLLRMSNNLGIALGPALGGVVAAASYTVAFYAASVGLSLYGLMVILLARETLPPRDVAVARTRERWGGYDIILRDGRFMSFVGAFTLTSVCAALIWLLLAVYTKLQFGIPESRYGLIPTTNALMVVFFQIPVTRLIRNQPGYRMLAIGALFYAVGVGGVAWGQSFGAFWLCMVILTIGELIMTPTATTLAANLAPAEMRGRYMSIYGLTWNVGSGTGPVLGGFLSDNVSPRAPWVGGLLIGLASAAWFALLARRGDPRPAAQEPAATPEAV